MGVMLSLDRHRPDRGRRRAQHARHQGGQARGQVLASVRRYDTPISSRLLTRVTRSVLARRPRLTKFARRAGGARADRAPGEQAWSPDPGMSAACLLGECRGTAGRVACDVGTCEHDCHTGAAAPGNGSGAGRAPAA